MLENKEQSLNNAVAAMFSKYPFVAGQAAPVTPPEAKK